MAVLPPLEKTVLQSRESNEDALEYDMSEDLEDSPAVNSPPPSSKPQKGDKYKNSKLPPRGIPLDGWYISVPGVSIGWYPSHMAGLLKRIKRRGHSLGLALRVVLRSGGDPERIGSG
ncbi:hypothetical protein AVEN_105047-1 [Araneus ventricosus]|uniref:Uncharacterized protein n=1 Tax=Araneus ventricosus TaxID=182803 RepID=A0A4Y2RKY0_ARAVE|nr:hypothetical protein AVEN_105047-1 [Araneus ventricosus]